MTCAAALLDCEIWIYHARINDPGYRYLIYIYIYILLRKKEEKDQESISASEIFLDRGRLTT